ncbi:energy transducer TonB [Sphingomonas cannabina]|uniref:energy transducer TonB n=1 Tax=Sphingomonas cannabina TaxID=2899123 RepID=UPI001F250F5B|nr:energy transducer TonB [Sphingomonas cannabina]UIJ44089.1 energy transducer TonB [Sphingomonas cannabina]
MFSPSPIVAPAPVAAAALQRWTAGDVRCGDLAIPAAQLRRPYSALLWGETKPTSQTYRFRIDADGRPLSITHVGSSWAPGAEDLAPSLAASRLDIAGAQGACEVTYTADAVPLAEAPVGDLISYSLAPLNGKLPEAGWDRIRPAGADCARAPRPRWLVAVSPDYARLPAAPGARDWTLLSYDLDAQGRPKRIAKMSGNGNAALDRAATEALSQSRQTEGPRRGCLRPYVRAATRLAAPESPGPETLRPKDATCPTDGGWERKPVLTYPRNWRRRSIEGWAIVTFDVAPWGETGNAKAVAS